jgi:hypothetical protein
MIDRKFKHRNIALGMLAMLFVLVFLGMIQAPRAYAGEMQQQPTGSIPTVTGTPAGPTVQVGTEEDEINVRSGPGTSYSQVGVLVAGQIVPAVGRSPGGDWIQIVYSGVPEGKAWVYAFLVSAPSRTLPIVEPPPTATPRVTPTFDPTLSAQFNIAFTPTRLPTFTPPPPLALPTFQAQPSTVGALTAGIPMGFLIIGMFVIGMFGIVISILRR